MPQTAWYNENDGKAAAWLRELICAGHLPDGTVDERDIHDVSPGDCGPTSHFFAGIGGWPLALRLAGWPDDAPVWTGSCPCQPFSTAGKHRGVLDPRHLWPVWFKLIADCRPPVVFGEQVASRSGRDWLAGVRADLEALGYAVGAADLCAAGVGAPHIRQRLFWVADAADRGASQHSGAREHPSGGESRSRGQPGGLADAEGRAARKGLDVRERQPDSRAHSGLGYASRDDKRRPRQSRPGDGPQGAPRGPSAYRGLGNTDGQRLQGRRLGPEQHADLRSAWAASVLVACRDGVSRRVEPGVRPLAHGVPGRVGRLRGYGAAIVPQVAATFIRAYLEVKGD